MTRSSTDLCARCFERLPWPYKATLCQSDNAHRDLCAARAVALLDRYGTDERAFRSKPTRP